MIKRTLIIDTDPGIDDAFALALVLNSKNIKTKLVSTVSGNVNVEHTTENALKLVEFFKSKAKVASGCEKPLIGKLKDASEVHGETGLNGYSFKSPSIKKEKEHSVICMKNTILSSKNKITILAIGPLTNIAILLSLYPEVKKNIEEIVIMGGSFYGRGNTTPMGEFNIASDPEAAKIVFESDLNITLMPLEIGVKTALFKKDIEEIKETNKAGLMLASLLEHYRSGNMENGLKIFDATAAAYLIRPEIYKKEKYYIDVELTNSITRGCTVVDVKNVLGKNANMHICVDIDVKKFVKFLKKSIAKIKIK